MRTQFVFVLIFIISGHVYSAGLGEFCHKAVLRAKAASGDLHPRRKSRYLGCQKDQDWMREVRQSICTGLFGVVDKELLNSIDIPKVFYFTFDGAADFNAQRALQIDPTIVNISGKEGNDLSIGNFNGGRTILNEIVELSSSFQYESRYYSGSGMKLLENYNKAIRCAKHIDEYLDVIEDLKVTHYKKPLLVAVGYSNGAIDAINIQNELPEKSNRGFDIVLTIDPVAKALMYHPSKLYNYAGKRNTMTGSFINYFQRVDHSSLGRNFDAPVLGNVYIGFKFKGSPVKGADINQELDLENYEVFSDFEGYRSHLFIIGVDKMWLDFQCQLKKRLPEYISTTHFICGQ